jgi:hypothetical protein
VELELARRESHGCQICCDPADLAPGSCGVVAAELAAVSCTGCRLCQPSASITWPTVSATAVVQWRRVHRAAPAVAVMLCFGYYLFRLVPCSSTCGYDVYNKYMYCLGDLSLFTKSTLVLKKKSREMVDRCCISWSSDMNLVHKTKITLLANALPLLVL